jgi:hypothetical protein
MRCNQVNALIDGAPLAEATPMQLEAAELHARHCERCGPVLQAAERFEGTLARLAEPEAPDSLTAGLIARIERLDVETPSLATGTATSVSAPHTRLAWSGLLTGAAVGVGIRAYQVLAGATPLGLTAPRIGGWGERLSHVPPLGPGIVLVAGLLLYLAGLWASTRVTNSLEPKRDG